jgi:hypothetical protein
MKRFTTPEEARAAPSLQSDLRNILLAAIHTELALAGEGYDPDAHGSIWLLEEGDRDAEVIAVFGAALPDLPFERVRRDLGGHFLCHLVRNNSRCDTLVVPDAPWLLREWRAVLADQL